MIPTVIQVALGGALGASLRYGVNVSASRLFGTGFPVATLVVNVLGSFLMGLLAASLLERGEGRLAPFLLTGVLGGFTTFSAFSLDAVRLWERGEATAAAGYVAVSVVLSIAGLALGLAVARQAL
jgi:CrcB protein